MADRKLKGVVVLYVNLYPDLGQEIETTIRMIREMNKPMIDAVSQDGNYVCLLVPTTKEATRAEKVDYNAPYPRYMTKSVDIAKVGLKGTSEPSVFKGLETESKLKGFITLYVNFHPEVKVDPAQVMSLIQEINKEALHQIAEDGQYQIMVVPTTKEASRIEKVDYDSPFPRLTPKKVSKTKTGVVAPTKIPKMVVEDDDEDDELEDDDGPFDELDDDELEEEGKDE